jgi:hypothetical protein
MAAWLTVRPREFKGSRELLAFDTWSDKISWWDHKGHHEAHHRPDLVGYRLDGRPIAVEVELAPKSIERLKGILYRHVVWRHAGKSNGVHYICGDEDGLKRTGKAAQTGRSFRYDDIGLTLILLDTIKAQALEMREAVPVPSDSADRPPETARSRRIRGADGSAKPLDQLSRRQDLDAGALGLDSEQIVISTHEHLGAGHHRQRNQVVVVGVAADARRVGRVGEHHSLSHDVAEEQLSIFGQYQLSDRRPRQHVGDLRQQRR